MVPQVLAHPLKTLQNRGALLARPLMMCSPPSCHRPLQKSVTTKNGVVSMCCDCLCEEYSSPTWNPLGTNQVLISSQVQHEVGQHHHLEHFKSPRLLDNLPDFSQMVGSWVHQITDLLSWWQCFESTVLFFNWWWGVRSCNHGASSPASVGCEGKALHVSCGKEGYCHFLLEKWTV